MLGGHLHSESNKQQLVMSQNKQHAPTQSPRPAYNLNKWKLSEPQVYLKPVEQTLYSAAVPINKNMRQLNRPAPPTI